MNDGKRSIEPENNEKDSYDLYTEKIVKNPWNKVKRFVRHLARIIGGAIVFGVIASIVMAFLFPNISNLIHEEETTSRQWVEIPTDYHSYEDDYYGNSSQESEVEPDTGNISPTDETSSESGMDETGGETEQALLNEEELEKFVYEKFNQYIDGYRPGTDKLSALYQSLRLVVSGLSKSRVSVSAADGNEDLIEAVASIEDNRYGVIIAENEDSYFILSQLSHLGEKKNAVICFCDGTVTIAQVLAGDVTTDTVVLSAAKPEGSDDSSSIAVAGLGNSYLVQQGDMLILMGDLYGYGDMVDYTIASATKNSLMDTDSNYRIICTSTTAGDGDFGILANFNGEIVGIIGSRTDKAGGRNIYAYGISELKPLLERLTNGKITPYLGVNPQTVTVVMQTAYSMPKGVYITQVEAGSPAYRGGIQSGDIITAVDGNAISTVRDLQSALYAAEAGSSVAFTISRPGKDGYRVVEISIETGAEYR